MLVSNLRGGARRDRTDDLMLAKHALSQLSYGPISAQIMVGLGGFEPPTPRLSSVCSNQLSYRPRHTGGNPTGLRMTSDLSGCSKMMISILERR